MPASYDSEESRAIGSRQGGVVADHDEYTKTGVSITCPPDSLFTDWGGNQIYQPDPAGDPTPQCGSYVLVLLTSPSGQSFDDDPMEPNQSGSVLIPPDTSVVVFDSAPAPGAGDNSDVQYQGWDIFQSLDGNITEKANNVNITFYACPSTDPPSCPNGY